MARPPRDSSGTRGTAILRLAVTLLDAEPSVVRRIELPGSIRLDRLHLVLQAAMPWQNDHLYEFETGRTRWGLPDPDFGADVRPATKATLVELVAAAGNNPIGYLYDLGDRWEHRLTVEGTFAADPSHLYPRLIDITGRCPPEDVGGTPGYEGFLDILADPSHPEHEEVLEWHGGPFDPNTPPADELRLDVLKLAKKWKPRTR